MVDDVDFLVWVLSEFFERVKCSAVVLLFVVGWCLGVLNIFILFNQNLFILVRSVLSLYCKEIDIYLIGLNVVKMVFVIFFRKKNM